MSSPGWNVGDRTVTEHCAVTTGFCADPSTTTRAGGTAEWIGSGADSARGSSMCCWWDYLPALRRATRVLRSSLRCFFFAIRLRRFLITEPMRETF
jgi:hypothetical protein